MMNCVAATISVLPNLAAQLAAQIPCVWILDNGSEQRIELPQKVIRSDINRKFVGGWNYMMGYIADFHPEVEAVWMMNDDVDGVSGWIMDRMWNAMNADPGIAVITPTFNSPHPVFHRSTGIDYGLREVRWIDWCVPLVRMKAWLDVGPFDEQFVGYGADIDWCIRGRDRGWRFYVHEGCAIHHQGSVSTLALGDSSMNDVGDMATKLQKKYNVPSWWSLL